MLLICALLAGADCASAQDKAAKKKPKTPSDTLTLQRVYQSGDFRTSSYSARWLPDQRYVRWQRSKGPNGGQDLIAYQPGSDQTQVLISAEMLVPAGRTTPLSVSGYEFSKDMSKVLIYTNTKRVWRQNTRGDYWILDRSGRELRKLGGDAPPSTMMFAKLSPDGKWVAYVHGNDLWLQSSEQPGAPRQLTSDGSETTINGTFDWVYEEELGLRDGFRWSPDSTTIAYWQLDSTGVRKFPLVNLTSGLDPSIQWIPYPKTGQRNSASRIGLLRIDDVAAETQWLSPPDEDSRNNYLARMEWVPGQHTLIVQRLNRLQNRNTVYRVDGRTGKMTALFVESDDAWVEIQDRLQWTSAGADESMEPRFAWLSERSGYRQIYLADLSGKLTLVTKEKSDVIRLQRLTETDVYFTASPDNPTQSYLFHVPVQANVKAKRLTPKDQAGSHRYSISPDGRWAFHTFSQFDTPPVSQLVKLPSHETERVLEENKRVKENLAKLGDKRPHAELFAVEIESGVTLDGWCIRPGKLEKDRKYPLLIYVYGEPAGTTVKDSWGGSTQMWHRMMAQKGYVVMSFDNRGTPAPKGRDWRKSVYRKVGIIAPQDQAAAVRKVLAERDYLDPDRVGVWGWSGGGSMTLNAMFKHPDLYKVGISIAPVPNQRLYDTIYQERYMGVPSDNAEGYREGSPINFAANLKGKLLLIHGTGDDNCHYQGMEALINELVRHNKPFQMMAYPNRSHSISEGVNTSKHLRSLMTNFILNEL